MQRFNVRIFGVCCGGGGGAAAEPKGVACETGDKGWSSPSLLGISAAVTGEAPTELPPATLSAAVDSVAFEAGTQVQGTVGSTSRPTSLPGAVVEWYAMGDASAP